jgi:hypothetical protein
MSKYNPPSK